MPIHSSPAGHPVALPARWLRLLSLAIGVYWLSIFAGTHIPLQREPFHEGVSDKFLHFGAYAGLALLLAAAAVCRWAPSPRIVVAIVALLAAYGGFDELTQILVGRDCELFDWCADIAGALVGSMAIVVPALFWSRRRRTSGGA
jgi:VanZ family protein